MKSRSSVATSIQPDSTVSGSKKSKLPYIGSKTLGEPIIRCRGLSKSTS